MGAPTTHADHPSLPAPHTVEVSDGIFAYVQPDGSWWINNTGFLTGRNGIVAIDTCSTERRTRDFLGAVRAVSDQPVRTLVNTHHHGDHTNGNCLLPDATIIGHHRCREGVLASPIGAANAIFETIDWGAVELAPPFVTFEDRLDVHVDDLRVELHFIGGPAHTPGDIVAWIPERSVLFAGDLVFNGGTPFVVMGSVAGSLAAVERLRLFGAETIVPGHGGVCRSEALDDVAGYLRFVQELASEAKAAGATPLAAAREADLGPYAELLDAERLVGNLHRAYAEIDGLAPGAPIDIVAAFGDMVAYNGGRPLRCLA
ncbi:MAG: cyclase [Acidimicrobiaceae bacterium]|nr:cyclase [Acidimicrobiaceae bacterium]